jgi:hypothetical protein
MADDKKAGNQLRAAFWCMLAETAPELHAQRRAGGQNRQCADIRAAWVDYVDQMAREGAISERLAQQVTL